jgi:hypothetical protein
MRVLLLGVVVGFLLSLFIVVVPIVFAQSPPPIQEFIPLPGPGQQPQQRSPQQGEDDCQTILFYHNGRLYRLQPGGPDQQPGGRPGTPPEFFYLNPYQGPAIPGLPQPQQPGQGPNFRPVQPRS